MASRDPIGLLRAAVLRIEAAEWRLLLVGACLLLVGGAVAGALNLYTFYFAAVAIPLCAIAATSTPAACVLLALTSPLVALGAVNVGFNLLPAYLIVAAGLVGSVSRRESTVGTLTSREGLLLAFGLIAVSVSAGNIGRVPNSTVLEATGANAAGTRSAAQMLAILAMGGVYFLIRAGARRSEGMAAILRALLVAAGLVAAYGVYQAIGRELDLPFTFVNIRRDESVLPQGAGYIRINSTLTEASSLAQFMVIPLMLGAVWLLAPASRPAWISRRLAFLVVAIAAATYAATLSKAAWLALAICLPILAVSLPLRSRRARWRVLGGTAGLSAGLAVALFVSRGAAPLNLIDSERYLREGYWRSALELIVDHPLGVGVGNFPFHYPRIAALSADFEYEPRIADAHNLYLELLAEAGVLGGLSFLGFLTLLIAGALHNGQRAPSLERRGVCVALGLSILVGALMHMTYSYSYFPFEWVLFGLAAAATDAVRPRQLHD